MGSRHTQYKVQKFTQTIKESSINFPGIYRPTFIYRNKVFIISLNKMEIGFKYLWE